MRKNIFKIDFNGTEINVDLTDPEMPEDVREYLNEYSQQVNEDLPEGVYRLPKRMLPPYVISYFGRMTAKILIRFRELNSRVKLSKIDPVQILEYISVKAAAIAADYGKDVSGYPRYCEMLMHEANSLVHEFEILLEHDPDWRETGARKALEMYVGVIIARLGYFAKAIRTHIAENHEQEDDDDEE